ncbi:hypothetical protein [Shewanella waksmanii]|uniref:hypothetical protein n=1 Tax=Shewanella waksmanii TaxID=213783 RepID=UPI000491FA51|nr:hypothetical protein [Shewanella waksmanii]
MPNIGHVQYCKGDKPNELKAVWVHADYGQGTGLAIGDSNTHFEGNYLIEYFDESGTVLAKLDLEIVSNGTSFHLTWRKDGGVTSLGVGLESSGILSAGYYDVV